MQESVTHYTKEFTQGKHLPKTPSLYYHTSGNIVSFTQSISSEAIHLSLQSLRCSYIVKGFSQTFFCAIQASYFYAHFS